MRADIDIWPLVNRITNMSFTNAPITRCLVVGIVASSIGASLFDAKHNFYILVDVHFWRYCQWWRMLAFQLCYTNSTEVLFAATTLYHMRLVERMWGPRKYAVSLGPNSITTTPPLGSYNPYETDMRSLALSPSLPSLGSSALLRHPPS